MLCPRLLANAIASLAPQVGFTLPSLIISGAVFLLVLGAKIEPAVFVIAAGIVGFFLFR